MSENSKLIATWNDNYLQTIRVNGGLPGPIARAGAMMHAAIYDAVNSIDRTHAPYLLSLPTPSDTSREAAVIFAAHRALSSVYSAQQVFLNTKLEESLVTLHGASPESIANGRILGLAVANAMIAKRTKDGSENNDPYTPGTNPGDWRPTGSGDAGGSNWPSLIPFTMFSGSQFRPTRPGGYARKSEMLTSAEYAAQLNEVKLLGAVNSTTRTAEQKEIAFFWANDLDGTYKPPGQLNTLTQIVAAQRKLTLAESARLFALVNLALADASILAWDAKYSTDLDLWRPETAIHLANTDGNSQTTADPQWKPLSVNNQGVHFSPPFPAYVSGHATFGATHAGIMRNFFGTDNITFTLSTEDPHASGSKKRTFNSFSGAALENARSRVYLGVHFQWDADAAYHAGTKLADFVSANFLRPC